MKTQQPQPTAADLFWSLYDLNPLQLVRRLKQLSDAEVRDLFRNIPTPTTIWSYAGPDRQRVTDAIYRELSFRDWSFGEVVTHLGDLPDDAAKEFLTGRWITPLRALGSAIERAKSLDAKKKKQLQAFIAAAQQHAVHEGIDHLAAMTREDALRRLERFTQWELEQFVGEHVTGAKRIEVVEMVALERGRRADDMKYLTGLVLKLNHDLAIAFLSRRTPPELLKLANSFGLSGSELADRQRVGRLVWEAFAVRVAREDESAALHDLRYLQAAELEAIEDATAALGKADATTARSHIRRIRDSLQVEQVKTIIDSHLDMWSTAVGLGVVTANLDKGDNDSKKWFAIALAGNLVWALTGFINPGGPELGELVALGIKVAGQIGGAIVGSNTAQVVLDKADQKDPTTEFRLKITDVLTATANELKKDERLIERVVDELWSKHEVDPNDKQQADARRETAWKAIFGNTPHAIGPIERDTVDVVQKIWASFWPLWKHLGSDIEGESEDELSQTGDWILEKAILRSGVADRIGYKPRDRPDPFHGYPGPGDIGFHP